MTEKKTPKKFPPKSRQLTPEKMTSAAGKFYKEVGVKIVTSSNVKKFFAALGLRMDDAVPEQVAKDVYSMLLRAAKRAADNQRSVVHSLDL